MQTLGQYLSIARREKNISTGQASKSLLIGEELLEAFENEKWQDLPEPAIAKGFLKNYASYLGLDADFALALYRRDFDETKYAKRPPLVGKRGLMLTPNKIVTGLFIFVILIFTAYLIIQYLSIFSKPKLQVVSPPDDITTNAPVIEVAGTVEKGSTVSIDGEFTPIDASGNFNKEIKLASGKNTIEIIAAKKLSPKARVTKVVRLKQ